MTAFFSQYIFVASTHTFLINFINSDQIEVECFVESRNFNLSQIFLRTIKEVKSIVITGGTRGLGYGLAKDFLNRDCAVTICGRNAQTLELAHQTLARLHPTQKIASLVCDVSSYNQIQTLWDKAVDSFAELWSHLQYGR